MWTALTSPPWIARLVALVGAMTLFSAVLPAMSGRVALVTQILPDVFPAAATTGSLAVGTLLVLLSRALRRGKFRAWLLSTVLTASAVGLHLVKGFDVEEAVASTVLLVVLVRARANFTARPDPRSAGRVLAVALLGPPTAALLGWLWLAVDADGQAPGTTQTSRLGHAFLGLVGINGPVRFTDPENQQHAAVALVVLGAAVLVSLLLAMMMPADGPHPMSADEDATLRSMLENWGQVDSLSYFSTRQDRSVLFSRSGKAAITYRVVGTVSLAAGDPIGDPESWTGAIQVWLEECRTYGWVPAVLGASETGAEAFHRVGLDALELGDEAVLRVSRFSLEGRRMRGVRQAVARCRRAGLTVTCTRVGELDEESRREIRTQADLWRDGDVERGFSMALGRIVDEADPRAVAVLCRDEQGRLQGVLSLVPWGPDGLSLDLMRRDRAAANGIVEQMVAELCAAAPGLGVERISLNFAVFRSVFARGERLGAGPVLRAWHAVLIGLSRFWQIESLYRANAKYLPEWHPRFLCFRRPGDLPRVATAALRAEAFLVAPEPVRRILARV